jgi:hypothetical protein
MRISLLVFTLVVGISCTVSYKFNGGNINYDKVKTISIADFPIKSDYVYAPLGTKFNEDLKDIFLRQTRLKLVNNNADLEIDGEITGYNQYNQAVSADGYSSETKLPGNPLSSGSSVILNHSPDVVRYIPYVREKQILRTESYAY